MSEEIGFFRHQNHVLRETPFKLEIERKQCTQPMRKYSLLRPKIEIRGFLMDLCCKMAKLHEFSKTWVYMF